jgi:hypothetical protein
MAILKRRILRLVAILRRHPGAIALVGFVSGVASFVLVDRQEDLARVIAVAMLASWVWLVLENVLRGWVTARFGVRLPEPVLRYLTQLIHQESLFFVLPFFLLTTVWNSAQLLFTGVLILAAMVSVVDPLYYKVLAPRRWLYLGYHTLTLFVVLLTALPIILQVPTPLTYQLALGATVLLSFPSLATSLPRCQWRTTLLVCLVLVMGAAGWAGRLWVPPPTLRMTEVAVAEEVDREDRAPSAAVDTVTVERLQQNGLYAYTAINAPLGLSERVYHVWLHEGRELDRIPLEITGGRAQGYRAWSLKQNFPTDPAGRWRIKVVTEAGQMIGVLHFNAVHSGAESGSDTAALEEAETEEEPIEEAEVWQPETIIGLPEE